MADRVLLVGSGAREHALAKALLRHGDVELYAALANPNPGVAQCAQDVVATETDVRQLVDFCRRRAIDFCVVGPEGPLEAGVTDGLEQGGYPCASPSRAAARIETSKTFMRRLLDRYGIPGQIAYCQTSRLDEATTFARNRDWRVAVKPVGLTRGKGVRVWGEHLLGSRDVVAYAREVLDSAMSGHAEVVVEELLDGEEFTLHFYCDGKTALPSPPIQDHKRADDGDRGPNTGGMGAYSCANDLLPFLAGEEYEEACAIGRRVAQALAAEGAPFKGILYGQFMATGGGPKVIEFNARFGDPEAINALARLETPYAEVCRASIRGGLAGLGLEHRKTASVAVYVVPEGYGTVPRPGGRIVVDERAIARCGAEVFYASCQLVERRDGVTTVSTGAGRTLAVHAEGDTPMIARERALAAIATLGGPFAHRTDIGSAAALRAKAAHLARLRGSSGTR